MMKTKKAEKKKAETLSEMLGIKKERAIEIRKAVVRMSEKPAFLIRVAGIGKDDKELSYAMMYLGALINARKILYLLEEV